MLRLLSIGLIITLVSSCGSWNSKSNHSSNRTAGIQSSSEQGGQFEDEYKVLSHKPGSQVSVGTTMYIKIKIEKQYVKEVKAVVDEHFEANVDKENMRINIKPIKTGFGTIEIKMDKISGWKTSQSFSFEIVE